VLAGLFALSVALVIAPKLMAFVALLGRNKAAALAEFGGGRKALASLGAEIALSALIAPVIMLNQVRALTAILAGRDSGWPSQARHETGLSWTEAMRRHGPDSLIGLALGLAAGFGSLAALLWLSPVVLGLVAAVPLAVMTSRRELGLQARAAGLFIIPEEATPPALISHANALMTWPPELQFEPSSAWLLSGGKVEPLFG
jgi:membrane glycosyltransferase